MPSPLAVATIVAGFVASLAVPAAEAAEGTAPRIVIRAYDQAGLAPADWFLVLFGAAEILGSAGIDVQWVDCRSEGCTRPLRPGEMVLRVARDPRPATGARLLPLGDTTVDRRAGTATLATVYVDRVERMASAGGDGWRALAARAVAHEVGHLVLGSTAHGTRGLMRPLWTSAELRRSRAADWRLAPEDAARMRRAAAARAGTIAGWTTDDSSGRSHSSWKPTS